MTSGTLAQQDERRAYANLDISGAIADFFRTQGCKVSAIDREDNILPGLDIDFRAVPGVDLPFPDNAFDIVVYNHVIEHVGDATAQLRHLDEINRVLSDGGYLYLSVPNRWSIIEPHYKLAFLSWLPNGLASLYARLSGRHSWYDCRPLSRREAADFMRKAGFAIEDVTDEALSLYIRNEMKDGVKKRIAQLVERMPFLFLGTIPTLVFLGKVKKTDARPLLQ